MESVKLKTHIGQDGLLQIQLPVGITDQDVEVMVIYQPVTQTQKRSWSPGFFERTFGSSVLSGLDNLQKPYWAWLKPSFRQFSL